MPGRPMLLHPMALVSFRLFFENLDNVHEFFGHMVYRPPSRKLLVRLCEGDSVRRVRNVALKFTNLWIIFTMQPTYLEFR